MKNTTRQEEVYKMVHRATERFASGQMYFEEYELFLKGLKILSDLSAAMNGGKMSPSVKVRREE